MIVKTNRRPLGSQPGAARAASKGDRARKDDAAFREHLLTVKEAAERTRVSVRHLRRMIKEGQLPVIRFGKVVRIHPKHLGLQPP